MPTIETIVITGGPCAGKTTAMEWIKDAFTKLGYRVLFISETATELINGGVAPWTCESNRHYQKLQMKLQMAKEEAYLCAASTMPVDKILIVCDRGEMDNKAYMEEEDFGETLEDNGWTVESLMARYKAVFHLTTAAKGAEKFYTTSNNSARTETVEEARALDDKTLRAWQGHPCHRVIGNSGTFDEKMQQLIEEIRAALN